MQDQEKDQDIQKTEDLDKSEEVVEVPHEVVMRNSIPHNQGHE